MHLPAHSKAVLPRAHKYAWAGTARIEVALRDTHVLLPQEPHVAIPATAQWGASCSERTLFIAEFLRRLREAAPGERVYMSVGAMFNDADVIDLNEWQAPWRKDGRRTDHGQ